MDIKSLLKHLPSALAYIKGVIVAKGHNGSRYILSFNREEDGKWYFHEVPEKRIQQQVFTINDF